MRRREFITLLSGATVAWPLAARAQQLERMRRIGVLFGGAADADDADVQSLLAAFQLGLEQLGWIDHRNVRIDPRWSGGITESNRKHIADLVALSPDVIVAGGAAIVGPLLQATRTVPIGFTTVIDPVGAGFVESLARPGGNATGFMQFEFSMSGKWLAAEADLAVCNAGCGAS